MNKVSHKSTDIKEYILIYNPNAGSKRKIISKQEDISFEDIKSLLDKYQIPVKFLPTKYAGHATELAKQYSKSDYKGILVAGGDGTVGEVANGMVGSDLPLGILPLGSVMNVARMLNIPFDLEKAVMLLKIGRTRKIDLGMVTLLDGEKMSKPYYFIESAGIGFEAQVHEEVLKIEKGNLKSFFRVFKIMLDYYEYPGIITIDDKVIKTRALVIIVSNGPLASVAVPLAPDSKLNDHHLTVSLFKMSKLEFISYFIRIIGKRKIINSSKVETFTGKKIKIETNIERVVHADARLYGKTPVEFSANPSALTVVTGFPTTEDVSLVKRTILDP